jgi:chromosome condensin MukBEF ATPase and DNA-binding subunit MukB
MKSKSNLYNVVMRKNEEIAQLRQQVEELKITRNTYNELNNKLSEDSRSAKARAENAEKELGEVKAKLPDVLDTLNYLLEYVKDRGLSAEDDCLEAIEIIKKAMEK